jgi:DNA-binding NarL/FixJ family response regulator
MVSSVDHPTDNAHWLCYTQVFAMSQPISQTESIPPKIMLVDDSELLRGVIRQIVVRRYPTCELSEAGSKQEAVSKIVAVNPHLVLLDINMPDAADMEVVARIRELVPTVTIIICSLREPKELAMIVQNVGADGYFAKDSSSEDLIATIASVLKQQLSNS